MARAGEFTDGGGWLIFCPACRQGHKFALGVWTGSGNLDRPTFRASMLVRGVRYPVAASSLTRTRRRRIMAGEVVQMRPFVCHSFVTDGRIEYLSDCTHLLKGQTVDLPDLESKGGKK